MKTGMISLITTLGERIKIKKSAINVLSDRNGFEHCGPNECVIHTTIEARLIIYVGMSYDKVNGYLD